MKKNNAKFYLVAGSFFMATFVLVGCGGQDDEKNEFTYESTDSAKVEEVTNDNKTSEGVEKSDGEKTVTEKDGEVGERPAGRGGEMPEEIAAACGGKGEGDVCSFTLTTPEGEENEISGECAISPRDESVLMCMSENMPIKGGGGRPGVEE